MRSDLFCLDCLAATLLAESDLPQDEQVRIVWSLWNFCGFALSGHAQGLEAHSNPRFNLLDSTAPGGVLRGFIDVAILHQQDSRGDGRRNAPLSQTRDPHTSPLYRTLAMGSNSEFKRMFCMSRTLFESLCAELEPYIPDGRSLNARQNLSTRFKVAIAFYYFEHGVSLDVPGDVCGLNSKTASYYVNIVADFIGVVIGPKWMGADLNNDLFYLGNVEARFRARMGLPHAVMCLDGTHVSYKLTGERAGNII
jgi:hypothetical protein